MPSAAQIVHLADVLALPDAWRALFTWKPFSITAFRMLHRMRRRRPTFGTILDGGANRGQFARAATEVYPEARIWAFEPLPDVAEKLRRNLRDRPQVRIEALALGSRDGRVPFHQHAYSLTSSALPLKRAGAPRVLGAGGETIEVPLARLDTLLAGEPLAPPVLLKLDLQGYELEALRGAPETLGRVDHVLVEVGFAPTYEGEATFADLYDLLRSAGFAFRYPLDTLTDAAGEIVQMDAWFARTATHPDA